VLGGLLGSNDEDLAALRKKYGISEAEPPSPMVSMGRGFTDLVEPIKQTWLNLTDQNEANRYRAQRAEDERLYQKGLLWADPSPGVAGALPSGQPTQSPLD